MQQSKNRKLTFFEDINNTRRPAFAPWFRYSRQRGQKETLSLAANAGSSHVCLQPQSLIKTQSPPCGIFVPSRCDEQWQQRQESDTSWQLILLVLCISVCRAFLGNLNYSESETVSILLMSSLLSVSCKWISRIQRLTFLFCSANWCGLRSVQI